MQKLELKMYKPKFAKTMICLTQTPTTYTYTLLQLKPTFKF